MAKLCRKLKLLFFWDTVYYPLVVMMSVMLWYRKCFIQRECVNEFICVNNCCFVNTQYVICCPSLISVCTLWCACVSVSICHCYFLYFICYYFLHWIKVIYMFTLTDWTKIIVTLKHVNLQRGPNGSPRIVATLDNNCVALRITHRRTLYIGLCNRWNH